MTDQELITAAAKIEAFEDKKAFLCLQCQECCKWISIQTYLKDVTEASEFYQFYVKGRGLTMIKVKNRGIFLSIPHICPHLLPGIGCEIYEARPQSCKQYDGRVDFLLKDKCKWNLLEAIYKEEDANEDGN